LNEPLPAELREAVFAAYGRKCLCCGSVENLAIDHVTPTSRNGTDDPTNLQPLCKRCNSRKGNRTIDYRTVIVPIVYEPRQRKKRNSWYLPRSESSVISLRVSPELRAALEYLATVDRRSLPSEIVYVLERHVESRLPGGASLAEKEE
jgi:hypothetical protein